MNLKNRNFIRITIAFLTCLVLLVGYVVVRLERLNNTQSYFDNIEEALQDPEKARVLIIRNQDIDSLPSTLGLLTDLKVLNLSNNHLRKLPGCIGKLQSLEELICENNQLTAIPSSIRNLKKLKLINLSNNELAMVPPQLSELDSLEHLCLASNRIEKADIGLLRNLKDIDLSENKIVQLLYSAEPFAAVTKLDLYNNKISTVPEILFMLERLDELILSGNPLDPRSDALYRKFLEVKTTGH